MAKFINVWSDSMDNLLLRSVLLYEPYQNKPRTKESGVAWKELADELNRSDDFKRPVDSRAA